jgi:hypothetical protein
MASLISRDDAFHPALKIRGPGGRLGGLFACGSEGAVASDNERGHAVRMMAAESQRDIAAHEVAPEARGIDFQIVLHGDDVGGLVAPAVCHTVVDRVGHGALPNFWSV